MIPAASNSSQVDSLPGDEVEFSIGDPRWVMRTQSDLYSNRELAVTREYSTNGADANKGRALAEGTPVRPIEVTLPSTMNPYFKVRDFGYGMSVHTLTEVYTKFGISTKRDSNEYNGMLGFGSKSAVAYTPQFTVTSVHNGIKTVAVITRKPDWSIVMKIVAVTDTHEESGTEITVPVHNPDEFATKAMDFYKFWRRGTVLVNGSEPTPIVEEEDRYVDNFYASPTEGVSYIVMGNVPYRIENAHWLFSDTDMNAISFLVYVDTGEVEFTPNREALKYSDKTKDTLKSIVAELADKIVDVAKAELATAQTHAQAYTIWRKWVGLLGQSFFGPLEFKGDKLDLVYNEYGYKYKYGSTYGSRTLRSFNIDDMMDGRLVITGVSIPPSAHQKSKANAYRELKSYSNYRDIYFFDKPISSPWIDKSRANIVDWETLKAELKAAQPAKASTAGGRSKDVKGSFDVYAEGMSFDKEMQVPDDYDSSEWFWVTAEERRSMYGIAEIRNLIRNVHGDVKMNVVVVPANRKNKFHRDYPDIGHFIDFARTKVVKDASTLIEEEAVILKSLSYWDKNSLIGLDETKIDDPYLSKLVHVVKNQRTYSDLKYNSNATLSYRTGARIENEVETGDIEPFANYPLVDRSDINNHKNDVYLYINTKYALTKSKDEDE